VSVCDGVGLLVSYSVRKCLQVATRRKADKVLIASCGVSAARHLKSISVASTGECSTDTLRRVLSIISLNIIPLIYILCKGLK
jgi:hypothetical protein